jgi:hypothetical protein
MTFLATAATWPDAAVFIACICFAAFCFHRLTSHD